jgi:hypothetical protein
LPQGHGGDEEFPELHLREVYALSAARELPEDDGKLARVVVEKVALLLPRLLA